MPFFCPTFVYRDMFQGVKLQNNFRLAMLRKLKKRVFRQIEVLQDNYREPKCYNSIKRTFNLCTFRLFGLTLHSKKYK